MRLAALRHYASSLATLAGAVANPVEVAWSLLRANGRHGAPTLLRLRSGESFGVRRALDAWVIKEVLLDREYARVGPPIEPGWTVVDIGAAHGAFALTAARAGAARVVAVEPAPDTCALLVDNLRRNAAERVETLAVAIGAAEGSASLALAPRGAVMNSTAARWPGAASIEVPMITLDALFARAGIARCHYLKMDCEGGEFDILLGASDATLACVDNICLEYHDDLTPHTSEELVGRLERAGFAVRREENPHAANLGWLVASRNATGVVDPSPRRAADSTVGAPSLAWQLLRLARPHQWVKNLLLLVALVTAHRWDAAALGHAAAGIVAMCFATAAVYVVNDWVDVAADRAHPAKRRRPLAAGRVTRGIAFAYAAALALAAGAIALAVSPAFLGTVAAYAAIALAYSFVLKRWRWIDVAALASLYVLRVIQGAVAIDVPPSGWLVAFALLLFASLALFKRRVELAGAIRRGESLIPGRRYGEPQRRAIAVGGIALAVAAAGVLAAYAASAEAARYYAKPALLLGLPPVLLLWCARLWSDALAGRGDEDPIVHAMRDPWAWAALAAMLALTWLAG